MKKLLLIAMSAILIVPLTACSGQDKKEGNKADTPPATEQSKDTSAPKEKGNVAKTEYNLFKDGKATALNEGQVTNVNSTIESALKEVTDVVTSEFSDKKLEELKKKQNVIEVSYKDKEKLEFKSKEQKFTMEYGKIYLFATPKDVADAKTQFTIVLENTKYYTLVSTKYDYTKIFNELK